MNSVYGFVLLMFVLSLVFFALAVFIVASVIKIVFGL